MQPENRANKFNTGVAAVVIDWVAEMSTVEVV